MKCHIIKLICIEIFSTIYYNTSDDCQVIVDVRFKMGYIDVVCEVDYSAPIRVLQQCLCACSH